MIDLTRLREDPDRVRASQRSRGEDEAAVDLLLVADLRRRAVETRASALRAEQKELGRRIARATADERSELLRRAGELAVEVKSGEAEEELARAALEEAHRAIPNVVADGVPPGGEADFRVLGQYGTPRRPAPGETLRDHLDLGTALGAIDTERAARVSGARFAYLTGPGALLELALVNAAIAQALSDGFTPVITPALVGPAAMEGTGFLGSHAAEVYRLAEDDLYLVGTSEVPLAALHGGEVLDHLPLRYAGFSTCFRREAGSYGKDTRGIIRLHQFDKVEMFAFTEREAAEEEHERLLDAERRFLDALEVPYRVIEVAAGDLGSSAARKFDCEAWLPSQQRWMEVTSTSNCTDFQARRLGIRRRTATGTTPVATLNGTLCAVGRTIVAILENHQHPDGSVTVPPVLRAWLGGQELLQPVT
ncbi:MAG: serine--tRNA ligase [Mycobacteriales bacterium]